MRILKQLTLIVILWLLAACASQPGARRATEASAASQATALKAAEIMPASAQETITPAAGFATVAAPFSTVASPAQGGAATPEGNTPAMLAKTLGNLSYNGLFPDHTIQLVDGYGAYSDGGSGKPYVRLVDTLIVQGDLDGDGQEDALTLLEDNSSGSGRFTYLAAVLNVSTQPQPLEALMIGDRTGVKSLALDGSQIVLEMVTQGPGDPMCCASWNVRAVYSLDGDRLVESSRTELDQISLKDLSGTQWRLVEMQSGQLPLAGSETTLQFENGQVSGFAGCNQYHGPVSSGEIGLNGLQIGPIAATKEACPEALSNQEAAYLAGLERASSWLYEGGDLLLVYSPGQDQIEVFRFEPVT
jgi:heat shock protein HslJ